MAKQDASRGRSRPKKSAEGGKDLVLVQCRVPGIAATMLEDRAKAKYTSVAAIVRDVLLKELGLIPKEDT